MKKRYKRYGIAGLLVVLGLIAGIVCFMLFFVFRPDASKYKADIKDLKAKNPQYYSFFPDEVPEDAAEVEWTTMPSIMQGSGFETLGFYTSKAYINHVIKTYGENARILFKYDYDGGTDYQWHYCFEDPEYVPDPPGTYAVHPFNASGNDAKRMKHIADRHFPNTAEFAEGAYHLGCVDSFPGSYIIMDEHADDAIVYVLYDNDDWNHQHIYGFAVVPSENYIFYFCE